VVVPLVVIVVTAVVAVLRVSVLVLVVRGGHCLDSSRAARPAVRAPRVVARYNYLNTFEYAKQSSLRGLQLRITCKYPVQLPA
jgi:hypothetical protein